MLWRLTLAAVSGILLILLYPPFSFAPLGWFALTPLIIALREATLRQGLLLGWITGTIGGLGVTGHWMHYAAHDYFALSSIVAALFTIAVNQLFVSVYFMLFGLGVTLVGTSRPLRIAALFVATEYLRAHVLFGNPWAQLGQSQDFPILMQVCDLAGVYGLTFLLALSAAAVADLWRSRVPLVQALVLIALTLAYGSWRLQTLLPADDVAVQVVVVQGALPNAERGDPRFFARHLKSYMDLTASIEVPHQAVVVWPENAVGFFPAENAPMLAPIREFLAAHDASLLFGAPRGAGREGIAAIYNSAYLAHGHALDAVYDKRVLLPLVESMPLRRADGPYLPGDRVGLFSVSATKIGVLICYEVIYAAAARELAHGGAQVLMNLSNDSWFDAGAGPEQHFQAAKFRAVENHVSLIRVTNGGVSGVVDASGREIMRLPSKRPAARLVAVPPRVSGSFYSRYGDVFAAVCIGFIVAALLARWSQNARAGLH